MSCSKDRGSLLAAGPTCSGARAQGVTDHRGTRESWSLPREPFGVFRRHLTLCPSTGLLVPNLPLPPPSPRCPPTQASPQGKLAIAVSLTTDSPLTLNFSQAISKPKSFHFLHLPILQEQGPGKAGSSGAAFSESCQPAPVPWWSPMVQQDQALCWEAWAAPDTFLSRTTFQTFSTLLNHSVLLPQAASSWQHRGAHSTHTAPLSCLAPGLHTQPHPFQEPDGGQTAHSEARGNLLHSGASLWYHNLYFPSDTKLVTDTWNQTMYADQSLS